MTLEPGLDLSLIPVAGGEPAGSAIPANAARSVREPGG